eukprot:scaffold25645_cov78-Skeletonema_dohrnii-CCMP3373.AAC.1
MSSMNQRNTTNQRSSKRHADPPKSEGGVFVKGVAQGSAFPRVSSYGNCVSSDAHSNNNSPAIIRRTRRRPHPSAVMPGINNPQLFETHRSRGALEDPSYSSSSYSPTHKNDMNNKSFSDRIPTAILVILWYSFGIVSIATSKILLSTYNLPPLLLTLQQLMIGVLLLRTLLYMQTKGINDEEYTSRTGLQSVPLQVTQQEDGSNAHHQCENGMYKRKSSNEKDPRTLQQQQHGILSALISLANPSAVNHRIHNQLSGSAAFVETIKAAEPTTSAATAVLWGIEQLVPEEVASLGGIIVGVVLSTLGHRGSG